MKEFSIGIGDLILGNRGYFDQDTGKGIAPLIDKDAIEIGILLRNC